MKVEIDKKMRNMHRIFGIIIDLHLNTMEKATKVNVNKEMLPEIVEAEKNKLQWLNVWIVK